MDKKQSILELLDKKEHFHQSDHLIIDKEYNVLYSNRDLFYETGNKYILESIEKCYELYNLKKPCQKCRLENFLLNNNALTWKMSIRDHYNNLFIKEETLYPIFNSDHELDKIVLVRLDVKEYSEDNIVEVLSCIAESKEAFTVDHSKNVYNIATAIGKSLGLNHIRMKNLGIAAKLHDVGNIAISEDVLFKINKLNEKEIALIQRHPLFSEEIIGKIKGFNEVARIARHHHENYDGTGYPDGIEGNNIPLESRIIKVADAYDAMRNKRVYKERMEEKEILEEMVNNSGKQFDGQIVKIFLNILAKIIKE